MQRTRGKKVHPNPHPDVENFNISVLQGSAVLFYTCPGNVLQFWHQTNSFNPWKTWHILGMQMLTCTKTLFDSPGMTRLCSNRHHTPARLELRMKFRAKWETRQSHPPVQANKLYLVARRRKVMAGCWRAIRHPDHFTSTGMLLIPSPNFAHALFDSKRTLHKPHQFFPSVHDHNLHVTHRFY